MKITVFDRLRMFYSSLEDLYYCLRHESFQYFLDYLIVHYIFDKRVKRCAVLDKIRNLSRKITDNLFRILYFGIQDPKFEHWQNEIHTYFHEISYSLMASPIINFHPKQKLFFNLLWDEPFEPHPIRHTEYRVFEIAFEEEPLERNDSEFREKLKSVAIDYEKIAREIKSFYTNAARELYVEHFISKEKIKEWLQ